ncbi:DUF1573 domain-containing protein [Lacinutrix sp.]|uniref:DUF1573 domain-containing protein n=1 Tax=Lacinutrix sp. TaxID=1937692 RepID=UPI0025BB7A33|nr:DUF1573 domain-containing protein [Lacinutrix sp.]
MDTIYILCYYSNVFLTKEKNIGYSITSNLRIITKSIQIDTLNKKEFKRINILFIKTSKEPLLFYKIEKSSKSISIQETTQYFPVGDTLYIPMVFHANNDKGVISEFIKITGNFPAKEIRIPINGYIK